MKRNAVLIALILLAALTAAQAQEQYFDLFYVQVKPEKRADFDAINKKIIAANRKNQGDTWLALETVYGTGGRVTFMSLRGSYADTEKAMGTFYGAIAKTYGQQSTDKLFQDFSECTVSTRGELRRIRFDFSSGVSPDTMAKFLGDTRWLRTTVVHLKPGQAIEYESLLKDIKAAGEKAARTILVAQAVAGYEGTVFYITVPQNSLSGFDGFPNMHQLLGDEGFAKYLKVSADTIQSSETMISRVLPELSNAPVDVAAVAPEFWNPKPMAETKPKTAEKTKQ